MNRPGWPRPVGARLAILALVCLGVFVLPSTAGAFGPLSSFGSFGEGAGQMAGPNNLDVAADGSFYVADTFGDRIDVFSPTGVFERAFGRDVDPDGGDICTATCQGGNSDGVARVAAGGMNNPDDVALGTEGNVYVADTLNYRIDVFSPAGSFLRAFGFEVDGSVAHVNFCTVATTCREGDSGTAAGEFGSPSGVAFMGGTVYVADKFDNRIDVYSPGGEFLRAFGRHVNAAIGNPDVCTSSCAAGDETGEAGAMAEPFAIAFGPEGDLYVADARNYRIDVFTAQGQFLRAIGKGVGLAGGDLCTVVSGCREGLHEGGGGEMRLPSAVAVTPAGEVYVAEAVSNRVQEFTSSGGFLRAFGEGVVDGNAEFEVCTPGTMCRKGGTGTVPGATPSPYGVAVVGGKVYVSEQDGFKFARVEAFGDRILPSEPNPPDGEAPGSGSPPATPSPSPPPPTPVPASKFRFGKLKLNPKQGTATLSVALPGAGSVSLGGKGIKPVSARVAKAMAAKLTVRLTGKAKTALLKAGKATVLVKVTFTPRGGAPDSQARKLRLRRSRPRH
jgi:hypothetical protein